MLLPTTTALQHTWQHTYAAALKRNAHAGKKITPHGDAALAGKLARICNRVAKGASTEGAMPADPVQWNESMLQCVEESKAIHIPWVHIRTTGNCSVSPASSGVFSDESFRLRLSHPADADVEIDKASIASAGSSCDWPDGESDVSSVASSMKVPPSAATASGTPADGDIGNVAVFAASSRTGHVWPAALRVSPGDAAPAAKTRWTDLPRRVVAKLKAWLHRVLQHSAPAVDGGRGPVPLTSRHLPTLATIVARRQETFAAFWEEQLAPDAASREVETRANALALAIQVSAENQLLIRGGPFTPEQSRALQLDLLVTARELAPPTAKPEQVSILDALIATLRSK